MPEQEFDVVVLGAGPVGQNAADRARAAGLSVAVVERELVGGECSYWACVPSKALLRPVLAISDARRVDGAREAVNGSINPAGVFGRRDRYVSDWDDTGQAEWVDGIGATLIRGHGRLDGPRRVVVSTPGGEPVDVDGPPCGRRLHRQPTRPSRPARYRRSPAMDESASHGQQFGPGSARGRRRGRSGRRNGHGLARVGSGGDLAGPGNRVVAPDGAVRG